MCISSFLWAFLLPIHLLFLTMANRFLSSTQNNIISADVEPDVGVDDSKFAGFLQKCAEKGIKPSCGTSQALEANISVGTHDDIGIKDADTASKFATSTVKVEPEVMSGAIQANTAFDTEDDDIVKNLDIPSIIVTSTADEPEVPSSSTQTEVTRQVLQVTFNYHVTDFL